MAEEMGVVGEPLLAFSIIGTHDFHYGPESVGVVHLFEVGHFVDDDIIQNRFRTHD